MTRYKCVGCGEMKLGSFFAPDPRKASGVRARCRACYAEQRRTVTDRAREQLRDEGPNVTPPRTFVSTQVWVPVDQSYYRNDGHRNIRSRGLGT